MSHVLDDGPFFHGTIADLCPGDLLVAGRRSNYRPEVVMNHVYFTALVDGAGLAAEIAAELNQGPAKPRVYRVEATGLFKNNPNVTDKKFPGNPTRSFRSTAPLRVLEEVDDWSRLTPTALEAWRAAEGPPVDRARTHRQLTCGRPVTTERITDARVRCTSRCQWTRDFQAT